MLAWVRRILEKAPVVESCRIEVDHSREALVLSPECEHFLALGAQAAKMGNHASAFEWYERALQLAPDSSIAHCGAGWAALGSGNIEAANDHFIFAQHYDGDSANAALGFSKVLELQGDTPRAMGVLDKALLKHPEDPQLLFELARQRHRCGEYDAAVALLRRLLLIVPGSAEALNLLGLILAREFGDLRAGEAEMRRALSQAPGLLAARSNLGWILSEQGRLVEALACFDAVIAATPDDAETQLMRAYAHLKRGEFAAGWPDFEARHGSSLAVHRELPFKECTVDGSLKGKTILVYAEQGLGDQIMFASCIPDLLKTDTKCVLECDERLAALFRRSFPGVRVVPYTSPVARPAWLEDSQSIELKVAAGSLPGRFRRQWEDFPEHAGYLRPDPIKVERWKARLALMGRGPYVGISWLGGARQTRRQLRSIPLRQWESLLAIPGQYVSLQYGECDDEISAFTAQTGLNLQHWNDSLADYDETAALVCALDLVISVCTAVIHLAGALGKPVWVLTPATAEWRYLDHGERLPWYPSAKLFRQAKGESWDAVLQRAEVALKSFKGNP